MTSSKKKHHPPVAAAPPTPSAPRRLSPTAKHDWIVRALGALAIIVGAGVTLIGATPDILGGWGTLAMMVPGMIVVAGGFIAIVETTSMARSRRHLR